jgi:Tetratricopeptide repeat/Photosynthetic reaction centre cytochrome C subunit
LRLAARIASSAFARLAQAPRISLDGRAMPSRFVLRTTLLLAALSACVGQGSRPAAPPAGPAPQFGQAGPHRNLKVLPDTISREALLTVMRGFATSLGVRCTHCHTPATGGPPDSIDFASDAKPTKEVARGMMRMVRQINGDLLPAIPELGDQPMRVGCITCHRGAPRPVMLEDTLLTVAHGLGVDSAVAAYGALRTRYYGGFTYDFGERPLGTLAARLAAEGRQADALRIREFAAQQFPSSASAAYELGRAYEAAGQRDRAIEQYRRAVTLQPNHRQAQERLRELSPP